MMIDNGILMEWYHTSLIGDLGWFCGCGAFAGDRALQLRKLVSFVKLDPPLIPWWDVTGRHISAPNIFMLSVGLEGWEASEDQEEDLRPVDAHSQPFPVLADTPMRSYDTVWRVPFFGYSEDPFLNKDRGRITKYFFNIYIYLYAICYLACDF